MSCDKNVPDVSQWLVYEPRFIDPSRPTGVWFCEDAQAVQAVGVNAVCLPTLGHWNDLYQCTEFFNRFPYVLIVAADPGRRKEMVEAIRSRLSFMPLLVAPAVGFKDCRSVPELLEKCGLKRVEELINGAVELPAYGIINLKDTVVPETWKLPRALSRIHELDRAIGGFLMGELSIWTGKRGEGKSTLLNQILLQSIDQGHKVCAYSGELTAWRFKEWAMLQAAGPGHVTPREDKESGKTFYAVPQPIQEQIDAWWDKRFFLYDLGIATAHDEDSILNVFTMAVRRYGCDVFLVDNIMTANLKGAREADFYRAQSSFTGRLVSFAKRYGVHVHLVAHPRKTANKSLEADDVGGAGDITNRADNVFSLKRIPEGAEKGYDSVLEVLKNRSFGNKVKIGLDFEPTSRRFYKAGTGSPGWRFGWDFSGQQEFFQVAQPTPFEAEGKADPEAGERPIPGGLVRYR